MQTDTNSGRRLRKIQIFLPLSTLFFSLISRDCILKYFHSKNKITKYFIVVGIKSTVQLSDILGSI